jgi:peptidase E
MRIVAIGGGEIGRLETLELDAEVVRLTGKRRPRVVFLPTATADDPGYVAIVEQHYGQRLGCEVSPYCSTTTERPLATSNVRFGQRTSSTWVAGTRCG